MEDIGVILERHEQQIKALKKDMSDLHGVQSEIRSMHETLVVLATELKHTNEHLARNEQKIDEIDRAPKVRMQQVITAIIAALSGALISTIVSFIFA
jgi:peptidoglycan hydrolase CwlO-like protein